MNWTDHAVNRANERLPGQDIALLYAQSKRTGKKTRQKIKAACPVSARKWMTGGFAGRYFRITKCGVVFVMQAPETVVTVFKLEKAK